MRRLEIHMREGAALDLVLRAIRATDPIDYHVVEPQQRDRRLISVFLRDGQGQSLMDTLQSCLEGETDWRISLSAIEATSPPLDMAVGEKSEKKNQARALREELYNDISVSARLDRDFLILVALSTIVAAVGLHSNSVAAVIGAMVIAPLLGPILGFAFATALGDQKLLFGSGKTLLAGISLALLCSVLIAFCVEVDLTSRELISRAEVRLDGVALAIAAGCAAALSLARGQGTVLVGVMVAAALLPPGAAIGLFLGSGAYELALRAALLLTLNVASLVFAALVMFRFKKVQPRSWLERQDADRAVKINLGLSLSILVLAIFLIVMLDLGARLSIG